MTEIEFDYLMATRRKEDTASFNKDTVLACEKAG